MGVTGSQWGKGGNMAAGHNVSLEESKEREGRAVILGISKVESMRLAGGSKMKYKLGMMPSIFVTRAAG